MKILWWNSVFSNYKDLTKETSPGNCFVNMSASMVAVAAARHLENCGICRGIVCATPCGSTRITATVRTCVKMEPFVLLAFPSFSLILIAFFASKLDICPLECSVLGVERANLGVEKDQWRSKTPKQPNCLQNKGRCDNTKMGLTLEIGLKVGKKDDETGEKHQKDKWLHFHEATCKQCDTK